MPKREPNRFDALVNERLAEPSCPASDRVHLKAMQAVHWRLLDAIDALAARNRRIIERGERRVARLLRRSVGASAAR
jgi:hypothetical protein